MIYNYSEIIRCQDFSGIVTAAFVANNKNQIDSAVVEMLCGQEVFGGSVKPSLLSARDCLFLCTFVASINDVACFLLYENRVLSDILCDPGLVGKHENALRHYIQNSLSDSKEATESLRLLCTHAVINSAEPLFRIVANSRELDFYKMFNEINEADRALELGIKASDLKEHFNKFYRFYSSAVSPGYKPRATYETNYVCSFWKRFLEKFGPETSALELNAIANSSEGRGFDPQILRKYEMYPFLEESVIQRIFDELILERESSSTTLDLISNLTGQEAIESGVYQKAFRPELAERLAEIYIHSVPAAFISKKVDSESGLPLKSEFRLPTGKLGDPGVASLIRSQVASHIASNLPKYETLIKDNKSFDARNCERIGALMVEEGHQQTLIDLCSTVAKNRKKLGFESLIPSLLTSVKMSEIEDRKLVSLVKKLSIKRDFQL